MDYITAYIASLDNEEMRDSIRQTSQSVVDKIASHFKFTDQLTGLLLGQVQSGKTGQMLGIISRLADTGYKVFLLLTTDNVDLQRQTYRRVAQSLSLFNVYSEKDEVDFEKNGVIKPMVIVLKKNNSVLRKWNGLIARSNYCQGIPLVVMDDEGDASSLNTKVNKQGTSPIHRYLKEIKSAATSCIYLEVTATPQALLLQTQLSGWKPAFIEYFEPGKQYAGGNFFYSDPKSFTVMYTNEQELPDVIADDDVLFPKGLQDSLMSFLINCAHKQMKGETNCNFMIHPSSRIFVHKRFEESIRQHLNLLIQSFDDVAFDENLRATWLDLQKTKPNLEPYEDIKEVVISIVESMALNIIPLNSKSFVCRDSDNPDALDLSKGFNIVIGGNTLGRGITFPHLQTVYYCRSSKVPQADTFWQHSRIFGYDMEKELVRIFIPPTLHKLFVDLNKSNELIVNQVIKGKVDIEIIYAPHIKPTRKNVLHNKYLNFIQGGVNMFPTEPLSVNVKEIDSLISDYASHESVEVDLDVCANLLGKVANEMWIDFNPPKLVNCIHVLSSKRPSIKARLIVRLNRNISKGTGTLLSENDRQLGDRYNKEIVLTMYRLNGTKDRGWEGSPLWVPNIKFPSDCCFYDVEEEA